MSLGVEYVSHHLFVDGIWGKLTRDNYFRCFCKNCPFSLLMNVEYVAGRKIAVSCRRVVFPIHCHDSVLRRKVENKKMIQRQLVFIERHPHDPRAVSFMQNHTFWEGIAKQDSKTVKKHFINLEAVKVYGLNHPEKSAKKINVDCNLSLNTRSICNMLRREKIKSGRTVDLNDLIRNRTRLFLGNDGVILWCLAC